MRLEYIVPYFSIAIDQTSLNLIRETLATVTKTGIVIGSETLLIGFVSILKLQKKNKFNNI